MIVLIFNGVYAQTSEKELLKKTEEVVAKIGDDKPNGWAKKGMFTFLANQATFNNWLAGGQSNISGNVGVNYDFNYKKTLGIGIINLLRVMVLQKLKIRICKNRMTVYNSVLY